MKNVLKEVLNENDRKTSEGEGGLRVRENDDNEMKQVLHKMKNSKAHARTRNLCFWGH